MSVRWIVFFCLGIACVYLLARNEWVHKFSMYYYSGSSNLRSAKHGEDAKVDNEENLFTKEELWQHYRGYEDSKGLYVAVMGRVYDVAQGVKFYAPGGSYHFFAGRDGTKAYSTGEFNEEGLTDIVVDVELHSYLDFATWVQFFDKTYGYVGKLVGNFYDEHGKPTHALIEAEKMMKKAKRGQEAEEEENIKFPGCDYELKEGMQISCTKDSGGVTRDWVGVPRLWQPEGSDTAVCACVRNSGPPSLGHTDIDNGRGDLDYPYFEEYRDCDPTSSSCMEKFKNKDTADEL